MAITVTNEQRMNRDVSVPGENGRPQRVATMSGRVSPGASMSVSLLVHDGALAAEHRAEISAALDALWTELRAAAAAAGLPV